jgi:hypothetical protein
LTNSDLDELQFGNNQVPFTHKGRNQKFRQRPLNFVTVRP